MSTAQLRTVVACDEAGVSIVKGGGLSGRVLVMPAPATMADRADGPVRMSSGESPLLRDPRLDPVWEAMCGNGKGLLEDYVASIPVCQLAGDGCECHAQLTVRRVGTSWARVCWVHDGEKLDEQRLNAVARHNRAVLSIRRVVSALRLPAGHALTLPELCWYLTLEGLITVLPNAIQREVLGRPATDMAWSWRGGYVQTDDAFQALPDAQLTERAKPVLKLVVDDEAPLTFIPRPKPLYWTSRPYLQWVKRQPCCVCERQADDPHHVIGHGQGKMGGKAHDLLAIPLCRQCHNELHADMWTWERAHGPQSLFLQRTLDKALALGVIA